jgi:homoserine dehydrogenase
MKNSKLVKIGILGLGVVGSELVSLIRKNAKRIAHETGVTIEIEKIYVRTMYKTRTIDMSGLNLTTDYNEIINDPGISIICECIGGDGYEETAHIVGSCLKHNKHVIMSSKKALAKFASVLLDTAYQNKSALKYDATVGGGIPIAKVLEHSFKGDELTRIYGVFNATSNFIYSRMFEEKQSFAVALKEAQDKGYAENNPSDDVDGFDSLYKLIILTMFGIKKIIAPDAINPGSFKHIDVKDMEYARELGYRIKPVSALVVQNGGYSCKVAPFLVPDKHIVAQASDNYNAIIMEGRKCGELGFYGQGAGAAPTATAMFDDLIGLLSPGSEIDCYPFAEVDNKKVDDLPSRYYLRLTVKNEAGILSKISGLLALKEVNIERIIQKVEHKEGIEIVMLTNKLNKNLLDEIIELYRLEGLVILAFYPVVD